MKTNWHKVRLGDVCEYCNEKIETASLNAINYISTENMLPEKAGITASAGLPSTQFTQKYFADTILISNIRPYFKKIWYAVKDGGCSNDVLVFKTKENYLPKFLYYILSDDKFFDYSTKTSKGTKMPRGDKTSIMNYMVPDVPLPAQRAIAATLSCLDDKIELNRRINANLEAQTQAIFKSWFVDFEPFEGGEFVESELGRIPKGWRVEPLSNLATITMGQSPDGSSYNETGEGTVFYQGRAEFGWRFPVTRLYTTEPKRMAIKGDILMSVRAPVGDINIANEDCCIGRGLAAINSNFPSFLLYTIQSLKPQLDRFNGEGTVFGSINKDSLNGMNILVPSQKIIQDFETTISVIDADIFINEKQSRALAAIRDALLPKLMSGEIEAEE